MGKLFDELKRRNVIRVAVAYAVAAWVLLQVSDLVLENINAPDWVIQTFMLALAGGLPLVLLFAWAFELTPDGLKRQAEVDRNKSVTHETAKRLDKITIGMLVLVVALVFVERNFFSRSDMQPADSGQANIVAEKSIAVLAFEDLSQAGDQAYFAEGLSEELLNLLAKIPDLQVAGRTSSFAFKGQQRDLREIGEILNVAHVLEGSVRKAGNNIRVTAQLISTSDGFHLFSDTYDDELSDIFAVQDSIAKQITAALKTELIGEDAVSDTAVTDVRAYELFLEARQKLHTRGGEALREASALLDAALIIDPDYAPALAQKALALALLSDSPGAYGDVPVTIAYPQARTLADRALALDPDEADAHALLGLILPWSTEAEQAESHLRRALEINPAHTNANLWLATLYGMTNRDAEEIALLEQVVQRDPLFPPAFGNLILHYVTVRDRDKASALIDRYERAAGDTPDVRHARARLAETNGMFADAIRHYRKALEMGTTSTVTRFNYGFAAWSIGDIDSLPEVQLVPFDAIYQLESGDFEQAIAVAESVPMHTHSIGPFRTRSFVYLRTGKPEKIVAMIENDFGGLDAFLERFPQTASDGLGHLTDVAVTYQQLGREEEFQEVLQVIRRALDAQQDRPVDPLGLLYGEASYASLKGDADRLLGIVEQFVDANDVDADPMRDPVFDPYRDDPRFKPVIDTLRARANAERAKLGLPPYQPVLSNL